MGGKHNMVLNHKIAQWYERDMTLAKLYNEAWRILADREHITE